MPLPEETGVVRVVAGQYAGQSGPAKTFTPINLWDVSLRAGKSVQLPMPDGHTTALLVVTGTVALDGGAQATEGEMAVFTRAGEAIALTAETDTVVLLMDGEPLADLER